MKKIILSIMILVGMFTLTGCGKPNGEKLKEYLEENEFECIPSSKNNSTTICTKEDDEKKREFYIDHREYVINGYNETIYDSETVKISIADELYREDGMYPAVYVRTDPDEKVPPTPFYPERCEIDNAKHCYLHVGEKVYPGFKEEYDRNKEYFESESYRRYLILKEKKEEEELSYEENSEYLILLTKLANYDDIREVDKYTEDVNNALRYYEKTLSEVGITPGE